MKISTLIWILYGAIFYKCDQIDYVVTVGYSKEIKHTNTIRPVYESETFIFITDELAEIKRLARRKNNLDYVLMASSIYRNGNRREKEGDECVLKDSNKYNQLKNKRVYKFKTKRYYLKIVAVEGTELKRVRVDPNSYSALIQPLIVNGGSMGYTLNDKATNSSIEVVCIDDYQRIRNLTMKEEYVAKLRLKK